MCLGQSDAVAGFVDYMYKTIIPACFIVPSKSSFDLNDGHTFQASSLSIIIIVIMC